MTEETKSDIARLSREATEKMADVMGHGVSYYNEEALVEFAAIIESVFTGSDLFRAGVGAAIAKVHKTKTIERVSGDSVRSRTAGDFSTDVLVELRTLLLAGYQLVHWMLKSGVDETMCGAKADSGSLVGDRGVTCPLCQCAWVGYKAGRADGYQSTKYVKD
jgi:hypothetical protein